MIITARPSEAHQHSTLKHLEPSRTVTITRGFSVRKKDVLVICVIYEAIIASKVELESVPFIDFEPRSE